MYPFLCVFCFHPTRQARTTWSETGDPIGSERTFGRTAGPLSFSWRQSDRWTQSEGHFLLRMMTAQDVGKEGVCLSDNEIPIWIQMCVHMYTIAKMHSQKSFFHTQHTVSMSSNAAVQIIPKQSQNSFLYYSLVIFNMDMCVRTHSCKCVHVLECLSVCLSVCCVCVCVHLCVCSYVINNPRHKPFHY